ncbi:orotate phosphoribosyltransferase [Rhodococcus sp. ACPA4]|nr:orotate phosphoribosyltransferase [Rhodococcus sp. ACPA4]
MCPSTRRLTGKFTLRSGITASEYFDKYLFETDPDLLRRIADSMAPLVPQHTEILGGLEMGGIPIVTMLSQATGLPAVFIRKEPKSYGTNKLAEGIDVAGKTVTLVEDVITTGGAVRNAALALRELGADVSVVLCAIGIHQRVLGFDTRSLR